LGCQAVGPIWFLFYRLLAFQSLASDAEDAEKRLASEQRRLRDEHERREREREARLQAAQLAAKAAAAKEQVRLKPSEKSTF